MKRIGILAEDLAGGCLVTVDYSKKAGFPRIAKCIYSVNPCQQKLVETASFNELFSTLWQKWQHSGNFDPKMTPKRQNDCARTAEIFNRPGAFCG